MGMSLQEILKEVKSFEVAEHEVKRDILNHAKHWGGKMVEWKKTLKKEHPEIKWTEWIEEHCKVSYSTCQKYMRIAKGWNQPAFVKARESSLTYPTISGAIDILSGKTPRENRAEDETSEVDPDGVLFDSSQWAGRKDTPSEKLAKAQKELIRKLSDEIEDLNIREVETLLSKIEEIKNFIRINANSYIPQHPEQEAA